MKEDVKDTKDELADQLGKFLLEMATLIMEDVRLAAQRTHMNNDLRLTNASKSLCSIVDSYRRLRG